MGAYQRPGRTERVSLGPGGTQGNFGSADPFISPDARYIVFDSYDANLIPNDTNGTYDAFLHDRVTRITERVSVGPNQAEGNGPSILPSVSADGRYVGVLQLRDQPGA